jgi:hypothetical protein
VLAALAEVGVIVCGRDASGLADGPAGLSPARASAPGGGVGLPGAGAGLAGTAGAGADGSAFAAAVRDVVGCPGFRNLVGTVAAGGFVRIAPTGAAVAGTVPLACGVAWGPAGRLAPEGEAAPADSTGIAGETGAADFAVGGAVGSAGLAAAGAVGLGEVAGFPTGALSGELAAREPGLPALVTSAGCGATAGAAAGLLARGSPLSGAGGG